MLGIFGHKSGGNEDPDNLIMDWCDHLPPPPWVDLNAYSDCHHCKEPMSTGHKHHCRLCGHMFCSACTAKYHLPKTYNKKNKPGAHRVCMTCKDSCLQKKREAEAEKAGKSKPRRRDADLYAGVENNLHGMDQVVEIAPPVWQDESTFVDCPKCRKRGGKCHNCRACGKLFCPKCTSKMTLPAYFEKKAKTGPMRVCDECRFKIVSGAKLVEKKTVKADPEEEKPKTKKKDVRKLSDTVLRESRNSLEGRNCVVSGCHSTRVTKAGYCATHANEHSVKSEDIASDASIKIKWEGESHTLVTLACKDTDDLKRIDTLFRKQAPQSEPYEYVFRNEVIPSAFYDIFKQNILGREIYIRTKLAASKVSRLDSSLSSYDTDDNDSLPASGTTSGTTSGAASPRPEIPVKKAANPFKRDVAPKELKKPEPMKEEPVFKKPEFNSSALSKFTKKPSEDDDRPPSPPSEDSPKFSTKPLNASSSKSNGGGTEDIFKARAKNVFGAK